MPIIYSVAHIHFKTNLVLDHLLQFCSKSKKKLHDMQIYTYIDNTNILNSNNFNSDLSYPPIATLNKHSNQPITTQIKKFIITYTIRNTNFTNTLHNKICS